MRHKILTAYSYKDMLVEFEEFKKYHRTRGENINYNNIKIIVKDFECAVAYHIFYFLVDKYGKNY